MASTIFDLKISRCRAQSGVEYLSKFPRKFSESAQRIKLHSIDDSFIYNEVNSLLDEYQRETKKSMDYDCLDPEPTTPDPYSKIAPLIQRNKRMAKYDMPEELDKELQNKLVEAKLQSLLGDKYLRQMFARFTLQKMEKEKVWNDGDGMGKGGGVESIDITKWSKINASSKRLCVKKNS